MGQGQVMAVISLNFSLDASIASPGCCIWIRIYNNPNEDTVTPEGCIFPVEQEIQER
jgi:hypothetical protein